MKINRIDAVVFPNIPHEGFDFIIYNLCLARKIPTLILFHTFNIHTFAFTVTESIESVGDFTVACNLKKKFKYYEPSDFRNRLHNDFLGIEPIDRIIKDRPDFKDLEPLSIDVLQKATELRNGVSARERLARKFLKYRTRFEYARIRKSVILPKNFVFFPLHVEPELAISPSGGHFEEQYEAIRFLTSKLPEGWKLIVKEHPHQAGFGPRSIGFYKKIAMIPNVDFVETKMKSLEIIASSQSVATITGSAGVEAVRLGKPSWVLGYPWYLDAPGITKIDTGQDLDRAFQELSSRRELCNVDIEKYVESLHNSHFYGFIPGFPEHASQNDLAGIKKSTFENVVSIINEWLIIRFELTPNKSLTR